MSIGLEGLGIGRMWGRRIFWAIPLGALLFASAIWGRGLLDSFDAGPQPSSRPSHTAPSPSLEPASSFPTPSPSQTYEPVIFEKGWAVPSNAPKDLIGLTTDRRIFHVSAGTGELIRVVFDGRDNLTDIDGLQMAPDRKSIYFTQSVKGRSDIYKIPIEGGQATAITEGRFPAVSADGKWLAYASEIDASGSRPGYCASYAGWSLVVRNLASGTERIWSSVKRDDYTPTCNQWISWATDSIHLAYGTGWEGCCSVRILDTISKGTLEDTRRVDTSQVPGDYMAGGQYRSRLKTIAVLTSCCSRETLPAADWKFTRILDLHPADGRIHSVIAELPKSHNDFDFDNSGNYLLYIAGENELFRWSNGRSIKMGTGFLLVDW